MPSQSIAESTTVSVPKEDPERYVPGGKIPHLRRFIFQQVCSLGLMILVDIAIPLALYFSLRNVIGIVYALIISGVPPFLFVVYTAIRKRTLDVLGCIICLSFILSGVVSVVSGDARAALLRDSAVKGVVGCMFLITLLPIRTKWLTLQPLTYVMAVQMVSEAMCTWTDKNGKEHKMNVAEWQWEHVRYFKISMYAQTAAWGFLLVMELVSVVLMVESSLTVDQIVVYNNILTSVITAIMITTSITAGLYGRRIEKRVGAVWVRENDYTDFYANRKTQLSSDATTTTAPICQSSPNQMV